MSRNAKTDVALSLTKQEQFLLLYPEYGAVGPTLRAIGLTSRQTLYNWLDQDKAFAAKYRDLQLDRRDELISVVYRAAIGKDWIDKIQLRSCESMLKALSLHAKLEDPAEPACFAERITVAATMAVSHSLRFQIAKGYEDSKGRDDQPETSEP